MVQFGPADYALSMGWSRVDAADAIRETERLVIEQALIKGIQPRAEIATTRDKRDGTWTSASVISVSGTTSGSCTTGGPSKAD